MAKKRIILGQDRYYDFDSKGLNNNVLIVGASGSGKTRSFTIPNLLQANGSYIIADPKGNLFDKYKKFLSQKGYIVRKLDFSDPLHSAHYNCFNYIHNSQDIIKIAHMLIFGEDSSNHIHDPFWDQASQLLLQAVIAYLYESTDINNFALHDVMQILDCMEPEGDLNESTTTLDLLFKQHEEEYPDSYAVKAYHKFRVAADKTLRSILISVFAKLGCFDTADINLMTQDDDIEISSIGEHSTAVFVIVSDTDRSMDILANLFFTQAMNELCYYADKKCINNALPLPVQFILDDFATNCKIDDFPRMISSIRSRNISAMLMIQAESQLEALYGLDARTIIGNCDTYVYLGGNDLATSNAVAERLNIPLKKILELEPGKSWIFRRGEAPVSAKNICFDKFITR